MGKRLDRARDFIRQETQKDSPDPLYFLYGEEGYLLDQAVETIIDTAAGFALRTTFDSPTEAMLTTTDLNTRFVRPATDDIRVEAAVVRGRSQSFSTGRPSWTRTSWSRTFPSGRQDNE